MSRHLGCIAILSVALAAGVIGAGKPTPPHADMEDSLVRLHVTHRRHDPTMPWRTRPPQRRHGYATLIGEGLAITTETVVRNHALVELQRARSGERTPVRVVKMDPQANLAVIEIDPPAAADAARLPWNPIPVRAAMELAAEPQVFQFDESGQMQMGSAQTVRISVGSLPGLPYAALTLELLTSLNINGEGAPVMADGELAGIVMKYDKDTRTGDAIPARTIARFIEDVQSAPYQGLATAGFQWMPMEDPATRAYLNAEDTGGVLVLNMLPGSEAAARLQPGDVVRRIDGHDIDNMGFYEDPDYGRLLFTYATLGRRRPGEKTTLDLLRDGRKKTVELSLFRYRDEQALIPENVEGQRAEYLIEGGMALRELSGDYLRAFGSQWAQRMDPRLGHLYFTRRFFPAEPGERIVVLSGVLPDTVNVGYQDLSNHIVETVNGRPVSSLADVFRIRDEQGAIERIGLKSHGVDLVLSRDALPEANRRIARQYRIDALEHRHRE